MNKLLRVFLIIFVFSGLLFGNIITVDLAGGGDYTTIPEVISISVSPGTVSPSGSITIEATGRIGTGGN